MEWISVSDRLPETNKRVLTYADNGAMFAAHLDGYWYVDTGEMYYSTPLANITHWMPLPPAPPDVMRNRLAEYEDMEEQGLLLRLPCKLGDTVYWIMECSCRNIDGVYSICEFYGYEPDYEADCEICNRPEGTKCPHQYRISEGRAKEQNILMIARNLGKTVFLTREAAEKALEEV